MKDNIAITLYSGVGIDPKLEYFRIEYVNNMYIKYQKGNASIIDIEEVFDVLDMISCILYSNAHNALIAEGSNPSEGAKALYHCFCNAYGIIDINIDLLRDKRVSYGVNKILYYEDVLPITSSIYRYIVIGE